MDRRSFIAAGATAALLPLAETPLFASGAAPSNEDANLDRLFDQIFEERVRTSPQLASSLGLDKGPNAALKSRLETRPLATVRRTACRSQKAIAEVTAVSPTKLSPAGSLNREVVLYSLNTSTVASLEQWISNRLSDPIQSANNPAPISQSRIF